MNAEQLETYITSRHPTYVRLSMPVIHDHLEKVAQKYGDQNPNMKKVTELFPGLQEEMNTHLQKEERVLFPRIEELERNIHAQNQANISAEFIQAPIDVMKNKYVWVGDMLFQIRLLQN